MKKALHLDPDDIEILASGVEILSPDTEEGEVLRDSLHARLCSLQGGMEYDFEPAGLEILHAAIQTVDPEDSELWEARISNLEIRIAALLLDDPEVTRLTVAGFREAFLQTVMTAKPDGQSPYAIDGHPPMWDIAITAEGETISARPARVLERKFYEFHEVDGVAFQLRRDGGWIGQGMKTTWDDFTRRIDAVIEAGGRLTLDRTLHDDSTPAGMEI